MSRGCLLKRCDFGEVFENFGFLMDDGDWVWFAAAIALDLDLGF